MGKELGPSGASVNVLEQITYKYLTNTKQWDGLLMQKFKGFIQTGSKPFDVKHLHFVHSDKFT